MRYRPAVAISRRASCPPSAARCRPARSRRCRGPGSSLARGLLTEPALDDLIQRALAAATKAGATLRGRPDRPDPQRARSRRARTASSGVSSSEDYGVGVRVIAGGAWGFAATPSVTAAEAERVARARGRDREGERVADEAAGRARARGPRNVDVWQTPLIKDPFKIPLEDKAELLLAINREAMKVPGVKFVDSCVRGDRRVEAVRVDRRRVHRAGDRAARAGLHGDRGRRQARRVRVARARPAAAPGRLGVRRGLDAARGRAPDRRGGGREAQGAVGDARQARPDPRSDRTCGSRSTSRSATRPSSIARSATRRTSPARRSRRPTSSASSESARRILTFYADKTTPGGLATCGYDDDGVATQRWNLVENGMFVGYQTTREQAGWIGEKALARHLLRRRLRARSRSSACRTCRSRPARRSARSTTSSPRPTTASLITGRGSWSIDHQRLQLPVRRPDVLGGQGRQEDAHAARRRVPGEHARVLELAAT